MRVRAAWKRTIQVKPYESESLELAVETEESPVLATSESAVEASGALSRQLSALGDQLIAERMGAHAAGDGAKLGERASAQRRQDAPSAGTSRDETREPIEPDLWVAGAASSSVGT